LAAIEAAAFEVSNGIFLLHSFFIELYNYLKPPLPDNIEHFDEPNFIPPDDN